MPVFFRHEGAVLRWLADAAPGATPTVLADDGAGRVLLDHVPGEDRYAAGVEERAAIAADHHAVQLRAVDDLPALIASGVPDRRGAGRGPVDPRPPSPRTTSPPWTACSPASTTASMRYAAAACPTPSSTATCTPATCAATASAGSSSTGVTPFVGHPAFDILRLTETLDSATAGPLLAAWAARWRADVPGCDPERAVALLRPVAPLRLAAVYAMFLAGIEPSEHPYHAGDVPACLSQAAAAAKAEQDSLTG